MKNRKWLKILLILLAVVIMGVVFSYQAKPSDNDPDAEETVLFDEGSTVLSEETTAAETLQAEAESTGHTEPETVCVHVCGCVKHPGVYYLEDGSRVIEAVEKAGGLTDQAASDYVNLAGKIQDGEKIYIPSEEETLQMQAQLDEETTEDGLIDLNRAAVDELVTLPGIGKTKAKAIVSYREESGPFKDIRDILNVTGIGESLFEKIKDYIKV